MFFTVSKIAFFFSRPSSLMIFLLVASLIAAFFGWRRLALALGGTSLAALLAVTVTPLAPLLLAALENRFPMPPADAPAPAGIVLLGGFTDDGVAESRGVVAVGGGVAAVFEVADLARRWPAVPIVLTGGSNSLLHGSEVSEAELMKRLLVSLGVGPERMILEGTSRTTWENAAQSYALVRPAAGANWWLVTTAFHTPRAVGAFRAAGWTGIVARPGSYLTNAGRVGWRPPMLWGLSAFDTAAKEIMGLVAYRLTGRSSAWFPAP